MFKKLLMKTVTTVVCLSIMTGVCGVSAAAESTQDTAEAENNDGWHEENGKKWYTEDGKRLTGLQNLCDSGWDSSFYYFDADGIMQTGDVYITADNGYNFGERYYHFSDDGKMANGWEFREGGWYYYDSGLMKIGTHQIYGDNGKWYTYYFGKNGRMKTGWVKDGANINYYMQSGHAAEGWKQIDKKWYYFSGDGRGALRGWFQDDDMSWYLLDEETGEMLTGWHERNGSRYYMEKDGRMATGKKNIDGKDCDFGDDGALKK